MVQIFIYLLISHLIGDWIIQTYWMANEKSRHFAPLLAHVASYHIFTFGALYLAGVDFTKAFWATLFLAVTHAFLDNRRFEFWWLHRIKKVAEKDVPVWLLLGVDQSFHLILLFLVSFWLAR
jgi:hypothetical protein